MIMQSIAIIGAGPSGLVAAKTALECGLLPTVLEKADKIGGLWKPSSGFVWDSMRTNLSYHSCAFSDMPWENPTDTFPRQNEVYDYLTRYAAVNTLMPHIQLNAEVKNVAQNGQKWKVQWYKNGVATEKEYDFLIVSSGIFSKAYIPTIPGLSTFTGDCIHSQYYKNPAQLQDKVVAVVGNSFSGTEIAAEIALQAKKTYHIASKALWVLPRNLPVADVTRPLDLVFYSRKAAATSKATPVDVTKERIFQWFRSVTKQHEVCPELAITSSSDPSYVSISDTYLSCVKEAKIEIVRSRIKEIAGKALILGDGRSIAVDAIVFATGYECSLPFFSEEVLKTLEFTPEDHLQPLLVHKCVFHPHLANLAFVGMYRGPYFATMELQARLACHVFAKIVPAPTYESMLAGITQERQIRHQMPRLQFPHGNYVEFADELATMAGVLPDLEALKTEDEALYKKLWEGPLVAAHYRLNGHVSKAEVARKLIDAVNPDSAVGNGKNAS